MKDLKYLIAYIAPISAFIAVYFGGIWSFSTVLVAFVFIPVFEAVLPQSTANFEPEIEEKKSVNLFFDCMLYLNIPLIYGLIWLYFSTISGTSNLHLLELIGMTLCVGIIIGGFGINVAHELGHRENKVDQFLSKSLLLTAMYLHFFIEHNRGHHKNVATDLDPASSRLGENLYGFWFRSVSGSYMDAWKLENSRLKRIGVSIISPQNAMIWYQIIQVLYLAFIFLYFGTLAFFGAIVVAVLGFSLLECVNYIEHYGLRRKKLANGRYESVGPNHSWNSNHEMGRIFLYELTRHSDHHYKASRKYQVLRHFDDSPQMPHGYPAGIIMSFFPPLWFKVMNKRVEEYNAQT